MRFLGSLLTALLILTVSSAAWGKSEEEPKTVEIRSTISAQQQYLSTYDESVPPSLRPTLVVLTSYEGVQVFEVDKPNETIKSFFQGQRAKLNDYRTETGSEIVPKTPLRQGTTVFLFKVEYTSSYERVPLKAPVQRIESSSIPVGTELTMAAGTDGVAIMTEVASVDLSSLKRVNDRARNKKARRSVSKTFTVLRPPVPTQILVGTAEPSDEKTMSNLLYPISNSYVTSPFGMRTHPVTGIYKLHDGTDFSADCGTEVRAATGGVVEQATYKSGYGNQVVIDHGENFQTSYSHLEAFETEVGAVVKPGEIIGRVGSTGLSTGCHLHFMTIVDGVEIDPMELLP